MMSWVGLVSLAAQAPVAARFLPDESWLFSLVVAALVAVLSPTTTAAAPPTDRAAGIMIPDHGLRQSRVDHGLGRDRRVQ